MIFDDIFLNLYEISTNLISKWFTTLDSSVISGTQLKYVFIIKKTSK